MKDSIKDLIRKIFGEQNLYKMDMWKDAGKYCKHGNHVYCDKCKKELEEEE